MSFTKRVLYGIDSINKLISDAITNTKSWCNDKFALKSDIPDDLEPKVDITSGTLNKTALGIRSKNNANNLGNQDISRYMTIGNLIIQCGNFDTYDNPTAIEKFTSNRCFDIKFPKEFPTACFVVVTTTAEFNQAVVHGNGPQLVATVQGWDKTKFRVMADFCIDGHARVCGMSWIAIGN